MKASHLIEKFSAAGLSVDQIASVIRILENEDEAKEAAKREKTRERVKRHRDKVVTQNERYSALQTVTCVTTPSSPIVPLDVPPSLLPAPSSLPPLNPPLPPPTPEKPTPIGVVKKTKISGKLASRLGKDFIPPDDWRDFAFKKGLAEKEAGAAWHAFRDYHFAKGTLFVDWDAAWRNWVRNTVKFEAERQRRAKNG